MRDYPNILVAFLDELAEGHEFERWPHHITVLPWFKADKTALGSIEALTKKYLPIKAELKRSAMFGHRDDILVRLVESEGLDKLHKTLLNDRSGVLGLINNSYVNESFQPHITLQGTGDPSPGPIIIDQVTLVKKIEPAKNKIVLRNFQAG